MRPRSPVLPGGIRMLTLSTDEDRRLDAHALDLARRRAELAEVPLPSRPVP